MDFYELALNQTGNRWDAELPDEDEDFSVDETEDEISVD